MSIGDLLPLAATWTVGTALAGAALAWFRIGSAGLRLLIIFVNAVAIATMAMAGASGTTIILSGLGCLAAGILVNQPRAAMVGWLMAAGAAAPPSLAHDPVTALGEALLLGGITVGLCMGHWFLVDPHLPRGPMRGLVAASLAGLVLISITTGLQSEATPPLGSITYPVIVASGILTAIVLLGALRALDVPTYKGVQSATGLFYVATMTVAAFVVLATTVRLV